MEEMIDYILFLLAFLTIGPGLVEVYVCFRQVKVNISSKKIPDRLKKYLSNDRFTQIRDDAFHDDHLKILRLTVYEVFVRSLELCLGLVPTIWSWAESLSGVASFLKYNEIVIGIYFIIMLVSYDTIKELIWEYIQDYICQFYYFGEKSCNLTVMCKIIIYYFSKLFILIPVAITVTLVGHHAGSYFFIWLWLYFCLIAIIGVTVAWPLCILASMYQIEPFPRNHLWQQIEAIARSLNFPPMEILIAKRNILTSDTSVTVFAGVLCIQRILISDDFLSVTNFKSSVRSTNTDGESIDSDSSPNPSVRVTFKGTHDQNEMSNHSIGIEIPEDTSHATLPRNLFDSKSSYLRKPRRYSMERAKIFYTDKNIEAIVIHELGHWKNSHNIKKLFAVIFLMFFWFALMGLCIGYEIIYEAVGFEMGKSPCLAGCVIFTFYISGFTFIIGKMIYNVLCCFYEFEADTLIIERQYNVQMADLLVKRYMKHCIFPIFDVWYKRFYKKYPTLLPRLEFLDKNSLNSPSVLPEISRWWYHLS